MLNIYISDLLQVISLLVGSSGEGIAYLLHKYLVTYYVHLIILSSGDIGSNIYQFFKQSTYN